MKIKKDFISRRVADEWIVLAVGQTSVSFHGLLRLNNTSHLLWEALEKGASEGELVRLLTEEYEVSDGKAAEDVTAFVAQLRTIGCLEEEP